MWMGGGVTLRPRLRLGLALRLRLRLRLASGKAGGDASWISLGLKGRW